MDAPESVMRHLTWKERLKEKRFVYELIITLFLLAVVLFLLANFLNYVETREGVTLNDPLLNLFTPVDLTWIIFALIYFSLLTAVFSLWKYPDNLTLLIQSYIVMVILRIFAMYLVPLSPPKNMITLIDPFIEFFGTGRTLTKDLFFSGHTATLFLLYLTSKNKLLKNIFLICVITIALTVLLQHVHYTIDVLAAFFFSYGAYRLTILIKLKYIS